MGNLVTGFLLGVLVGACVGLVVSAMLRISALNDPGDENDSL